MKRIVLLAVLSSVALSASHAQTPEKRTLVFPPGSTTPLPTPPPVAPPPISKPGTAAETIDAFFLALKDEKVDAAYDALVKGTIIADRQEDVASLKDRTKHALDSYGPLTGYEVVDEQTVGTVLFRRTCLSFNSDLPLRWRFYFYKSNGNWNLVDLRVDDGLVELFEDAAAKAHR
jgi:hypothetical protein